MSTRAPAVLDDPAAIAAGDPEGMLGLVASLGTQLREGFATARSVPELPSPEGLRSVVVCGMGGSGVAGDVLRSLYAARLHLPIVVVKGYALPEFCGRDTLVMAMSFSGNTEETLVAYAEAVARGCRVVTVAAGGELATLSEADDVTRVSIPGTIPVPRAALGYLSAAPLGVLDAMAMLPAAERDVEAAAVLLDGLATELGPDRTLQDNVAKDLAAWLQGRTPVVWGSEGLAEAPAVRWKTQINENAKVPAWVGILSEVDHNEIEGWSEGSGRPYGLVALRHREEHQRMAARFAATLQAIESAGLEAREVWATPSAGALGSMLSLIMTGDFVATYLAILRGVDPTPVPVLSALKERLRP